MQIESIYPTARGLVQSGKHPSSTVLDRRSAGGLLKHLWQLASLVVNFSHWPQIVRIFAFFDVKMMFFRIILPACHAIDLAGRPLSGRTGRRLALAGRIGGPADTDV